MPDAWEYFQAFNFKHFDFKTLFVRSQTVYSIFFLFCFHLIRAYAHTPLYRATFIYQNIFKNTAARDGDQCISHSHRTESGGWLRCACCAPWMKWKFGKVIYSHSNFVGRLQIYGQAFKCFQRESQNMVRFTAKNKLLPSLEWPSTENTFKWASPSSTRKLHSWRNYAKSFMRATEMGPSGFCLKNHRPMRSGICALFFRIFTFISFIISLRVSIWNIRKTETKEYPLYAQQAQTWIHTMRSQRRTQYDTISLHQSTDPVQRSHFEELWIF